jgi:DNA-binding CsgD family transcriptional regulator
MTNFEELIDRIYEAAVEPEKWGNVLIDLARTAAGEGGAIVTRREDQDRWTGSRVSHNLQRNLAECLRSPLAKDSQTTVRLLEWGKCCFMTDEEGFTPEEYARDFWTSEWAVKNNVYHCAATPIQVPNGDLVVVQVMRRVGLPGFARTELDVLDSFRPHLARAGFLAARWRLERVRATAEALDLIGLPAAILDVNGRVLAANSLIQELRNHVRWLPSNEVALTDHSANVLLRNAIRELTNPFAPVVRSFPVGRGSVEPVVVHLIPATMSARELFNGGFGILAVTPITAPEPPDTALIQGLFDLTPAEARVAGGIIAGKTIKEMAACHAVGMETVRSQMKSVLSKIGVRRQSEAATRLTVLAQATRRRGPSGTALSQ